MNTKKIEKGIRYSSELDTYYVQFNFSDSAHIRGFPTLEDARAYRDVIYAAKLEAKIRKDLAIIREKEIAQTKKEVPYPYNAFKIVGVEEIELEFVDSFEFLLSYSCTGKEVECVHLFFKDGLTLEKTGKLYGITKERVRQIVNKAMRRVMSAIYSQKQHAKLEEDMADRHAFRKKLIQAYKENGVITPELEYEFGELKPGSVYDHGLVHIDDLDLSVRSYNCLVKFGVTTVNELVSYRISTLAQIKRLGKKSLREIVEAVRRLGFEFAPEEDLTI